MFLPYYKIEKTEKGKQFFFSHVGYFNFWDEYLIMNIEEGRGKVFTILVNRPEPNEKHKYIEVPDEYKVMEKLHIKRSIRWRKPKEMFDDFPELNEVKL